MTKSDAELLAEAIKAVTGKDDPALQALLEELLDMEQQVAHMARPHRILLNIEAKLKAHLGVD
jgi:NTP pyrophosphatase (non-canonical NTP hydrolase)